MGGSSLKPTPYAGFTGLDLRRHVDSSDDKSARVARNVNLTLGGEYKTRGQLRLIANLDPNSIGLFKVADRLHCLYPQSTTLSLPIPPPGVIYDPIGIGLSTGYPANTALRVTASDSWGLSTSGQIRGYVVVKRNQVAGLSDGRYSYEHHYLNDLQGLPLGGTFTTGLTTISGAAFPANLVGATLEVPGDTQSYLITGDVPTQLTISPAYAGTSGPKSFLIYSQANTLVSTGFPPGPSLVAAGNKFWATCPGQGLIYYSSTVNGPTDWTATGDAGNLQVLRFVQGDRTVTGLGFYEGQLAVFFKDAVELWLVGADPDAFAMQRALNGPGTELFSTINNVIGDLVYYSQGGFRSLRQDSQSGRMVEDGIGAKIKPLTALIDSSTANPVALWSQTRGQYLCAFGSTVYAMSTYPESDLTGWTTWSMPVGVDYMVEIAGVVYIRGTDNNLYAIDENYSGEAGFTFEVQTQFLNLGTPGYRKQFTLMDVVQSGTALPQAYYNSADPTKIYTGVNLSGSTLTQRRTPLNISGVPSVSLRFTGSVPWTLSGFVLHSRQLNRS